MQIVTDWSLSYGLFGGALLGLAAAGLLWSHGRVAGISGIIGATVEGRWSAWKWGFLGGMGLSAAVLAQLSPALFRSALNTPTWLLVVAGLFVGVGTRAGNGCTSGHGVCGVGRARPRSLLATLTFMGSGALGVVVARVLMSV